MAGAGARRDQRSRYIVISTGRQGRLENLPWNAVCVLMVRDWQSIVTKVSHFWDLRKSSGADPWSARVPLDPLADRLEGFRERYRPAGGPAADEGVRPTIRRRWEN